jgi:hypothetical protein
MKIRSGFVSNSSSSSFVVFGANIDKNKALKEKFHDSKSYDEVPLNADKLPEDTICVDYEGEGLILGLHLGGGSTDEGDFGVEAIGIEELVKYAKEFEKATGLKPKLLGGCYSC